MTFTKTISFGRIVSILKIAMHLCQPGETAGGRERFPAGIVFVRRIRVRAQAEGDFHRSFSAGERRARDMEPLHRGSWV